MRTLVLSTLLLVSCASLASAQGSYFDGDNPPDVVEYEVTKEVVFGEGKVSKDGKETTKPLWMDVYRPRGEAKGPRPAIILTYGGAFHRGHPRVPYVGFGAQTTPMSGYAKQFAAKGFVAFTITYRVVPDNPVPGAYEGFSEDDLDSEFFKTPEAIAQANVIRKQMGLDGLTEETAVPVLKGAVLAAAEDLRTAIRHVKASSKTYGIDAERIGLFGFSAGAVTMINVAYGMKEPVAAIVANSGYPSVFDMDKLLTAKSKVPPALFYLAQNDYPVVQMELIPFLRKLREIKAEHTLNWVPSHGHFYPAGAPSLSSTGSKMSVEQRTLEFFEEKLKRD